MPGARGEGTIEFPATFVDGALRRRPALWILVDKHSVAVLEKELAHLAAACGPVKVKWTFLCPYGSSVHWLGEVELVGPKASDGLVFCLYGSEHITIVLNMFQVYLSRGPAPLTAVGTSESSNHLFRVVGATSFILASGGTFVLLCCQPPQSVLREVVRYRG